MGEPAPAEARPEGLVYRLCRGWAILGGLILCAVVAINVVSVVEQALFNKGFQGDFELTEVGVALAAFAFLPYCQIAGLNVSADIFTSKASPGWIAFFTLLGSLVALVFGIVMTWRTIAGAADQMAYDGTTALLQIPLWWGYAGCAVSLALLVVASLASVIEAARGMRGGA